MTITMMHPYSRDMHQATTTLLKLMLNLNVNCLTFIQVLKQSQWIGVQRDL